MIEMGCVLTEVGDFNSGKLSLTETDAVSDILDEININHFTLRASKEELSTYL